MHIVVANPCAGTVAHLLDNGSQFVLAGKEDPRRVIMAPTWSVRRNPHDHQIVDVEELDLLRLGRALSG